MKDSSDGYEAKRESQSRIPVTVAWTAMLLTSNITIILWRELASGEPCLWPWVNSIGLITIFILTLVRTNLKPLRGFIIILLAIFFLGLGGGWNWGG